MDDPTRFLVAPGEPSIEHSDHGGLLNPVDIFNAISPSAWINWILQNIIGRDIIGEATNAVAGDWTAIWKFGEALEHLAECLQQTGINVQSGMIELDARWDGNASDAAWKYFSNLAGATSAQKYDLWKAQKSYQQSAKGAWMLADALGGLIQSMVDKLIIAGIGAIAGTLSSETGAGAAAGYGLTAAMVEDILTKANKVSTLINAAGGGIYGAAGLILDAANGGGTLKSYPLPTEGYEPPGLH